MARRKFDKISREWRGEELNHQGSYRYVEDDLDRIARKFIRGIEASDLAPGLLSLAGSGSSEVARGPDSLASEVMRTPDRECSTVLHPPEVTESEVLVQPEVSNTSILVDMTAIETELIEVSADITLDEPVRDRVVDVDASAGDVVVTLSSLAGSSGYRTDVRRKSGPGGDVIVMPQELGGTINGESEIVLATQYTAVQFFPTTTEWAILNMVIPDPAVAAESIARRQLLEQMLAKIEETNLHLGLGSGLRTPTE